MEKFNYEPNGYNRREVNQFVSDVIVHTEGVIKKCQEQRSIIERQKREIESLKRELTSFKGMENNLKDAIIRAEAVGDNIKRMAREEAKMIVSDAKNNASHIVNESLLKAEKVENNADTLERNIKILKRKLKIIMEQQMAVIEEIDELDLDDNF
ncbi:MAG: DivIVA domain-containing protein [Bacilli bacterium]|nr:DivIVA domain-containing protein [Bacilli bacterium]